MSYFVSLSLKDWRQFKSIDLDLSSKVTIITGSNGCGKTSILTLLSRHFGWDIQFASSPYISKRAAKRLFKDVHESEESLHPESANVQVTVGEIKYDTGEVCTLTTPTFVGPNYSVGFQNQIQKKGLFIPSHRPQSNYNVVSQIPTNPVTAAQMYEQFRAISLQMYQTGGIGRQKNPGMVQKEAIISLAMFGEGNASVEPNEEYRGVFEGFQERLKVIMPKEIGFQRIKISMPEVILETDSGNFSLDAMSGGVSALFSIAWQIHMFDVTGEAYTIVIDEPENHLHPSMQRSMLPALSEAFPMARFVVATHSPFIVSSFRDSNIYMLSHNAQKKVESQKLDIDSVSGSANSILRDILGVESTIPMWVEKIISQYLDEDSDIPAEQRADQIMQLLKEFGITNALSEFRQK